jgi:transposase
MSIAVVYPRCCGLDVHKQTVVACRIVPGAADEPVREVRTFSTMTDDLLALADWLTEAAVSHVVMESTGVYWKPLYNLFEGLFTLLVVNAAHIKQVPGRKTDVKDAEWLADLLRHGLLKSSFIPDRSQRELRELTRYRASLVREHSAEVNRLEKTLEGANIKLGAVATDLNGRSGRAILQALVAGQTDAAAMAQLARGRMRGKIPQLERALVGSLGPHQRFLLARQLGHLDELERHLGELSSEIERRLATWRPPADPAGEPPPRSEPLAPATQAAPEPTPRPPEDAPPNPLAAAVARLQTIPGVGQRTAEMIVAEIGIDMSRFPTARHLAAWAGMAPGNHESGGKRQSGKCRKGSRWLRWSLVEAAKAAGRSKGTYLAAQYARLAGRRGKKKGTVAVGHSILVIAYHLLQRETTYEELGGQYFDERDRQGVQRRAVHRLESLGYEVTLIAKAAA